MRPLWEKLQLRQVLRFCRAADVTADLYTVCYSLGRKEFDALLGPIEDVWRFEALRKVPVLFALSEQQLFELAHCMKNHSVAAGQMVFRQGDPGAHETYPFLLSLPSQHNQTPNARENP